ncbi:hypothetical protein RHSIM_Rhsim05G0003900 [Rhododendron simsii]|uniref:beta-ketoacyl-[acyl-carrier-protein] synthase I n=1 Tax=Rhododendron simsii TaxID=118357 RepID=A0A834GVB5_RHOSS|nr:hypothetical protein RHSIM_Rhsim05G0003900 [Rhododendron simsii]
METKDVDIDHLERGLLSSRNGSPNQGQADAEDEDETVLYMASFREMEENFVEYQTSRWVLYSLLLILAWGIGLFMLLYVPVRRYILRQDIRSRKLYVTPNAVVYKLVRPVPFPCFGVLKKEKHIPLPSVADVVIEQGYLQSLFGVYSVRFENVGVRRSPSDDVRIEGVENPRAFRKAVTTQLSNMRSEAFSRQVSTIEDVPNLRIGPSAAAWMSPSKSLRNDSFSQSGELILLQKLEEVGSSVKFSRKWIIDPDRTIFSLLYGQAMAIAVKPEKEVTTKSRFPTTQRRVVVTGMGVETSLGRDPDIFYNNLLEGVSGISEIEGFDCAQFPTRIAGEIKNFSTDDWVDPKQVKRLDKFMLYVLTAGKKALANGGITEEVMKELDKARCGVLIGSGMGGMQVFNDAVEALSISYKKMSPFCVPFVSTNMGSALLGVDLGWMGPNYSISTACATSNHCILSATNHIIRGEAGRDGFVMGEGAGALLLEELEHAKKRGAKIYAEVLGGSFTCDAYHMTEPHPEGAGVILCIERALSQSGVSREEVNYINAHGTSTPAGDLKEYQALVRCFGQNPELKVNSTKSMIGHLLGAAGAVEAVATVQDTNMLVGPRKERLDIKVAMSNSFGFGGHNSAILFSPYN